MFFLINKYTAQHHQPGGIFLLQSAEICAILFNRKNIFQRAADTSGRRLFALHPSKEGGEVLPNPARKGVNAVYEKILRIMLFTALFAFIFTTYAK